MPPIAVLDPFYLGITLLICVGWQILFFIGASITRSDKVTDFAYGTNFVAIAAITFALNQSFAARNIIVLCFICVWGLRLALYLFARVVKEGKDSRFDGTRDNFFKFAAFWIAQMITVWSICIPQTLMSSVPVSPPLGWQDGLGIAIWAIGFLIEAVSDQQKFAFKNSSPENRKRMMMGGLWSVSRHPNYFGECLCWWGIWSIATSTFFVNTVMYVSILSPIYVGVILLFLSGIPTLEKPWDQKYGKDADYRDYKKSVPPLVLFIPALYRRFPSAVKLIFCCEFPFYSTDFPSEEHPLQRDGMPAGDLEQQFQNTERPVAKGYQ